MRRFVFLFGALVFLTACGDPLDGITRLSEVEVVENESAPQALPTEQEISREGFFGTAAAAQVDTAVPPEPPVDAAPEPRRGGLFGMLRRVVPRAQPTLSAEDFAVLKASENLPNDTVVTEGTPAPETDESITLASLAPEVAPQQALRSEPTAISPPEPKPKRRGFLSRLSAGRNGGDGGSGPKATKGVEAPDVPFGAQLPYSEVARVCTSRRPSLGSKVETSQASGYTLWDSNPGGKVARTFYITGFDDNCPRQFTAAHALFGEPSFYEQLHYGPTGKHLKLGDTDAAYEKVKGRVCGVRRGKPCGSKMRQLERETVFISTYAKIDDNTRWSEILLHDDVVVATALKNN